MPGRSSTFAILTWASRNERDAAYRYNPNELYDYLVHRLFKNLLHKKDRYLQYVWPLVRLAHDVDDTRSAQYGVYHTQKKPLTLAALEGLPGDIGFLNRS